MQSSTKAIRPVATTTLSLLLVKSLQTAVSKYSLRNISDSVQNSLVGNSHITRGYPTTSCGFFMSLILIQTYRANMGKSFVAVCANEEIRNGFDISLFLYNSLPGVVMTPILKHIALVRLSAAPLDVNMSIIGELELDGVGR